MFEKVKYFFLLIVFGTLLFSCSSTLLVASDSSYYKWVGGQEGVSGTDFIFKIINTTSQETTLDSVVINSNSIRNFELKYKSDTIVVIAHLRGMSTIEKQIGVADNKGGDRVPIVKENNSAKLFFSSKLEVEMVVFDKIDKNGNIYYK